MAGGLAVALLCLVAVAAAVARAGNSDKVDSDLVFENLDANSNDLEHLYSSRDDPDDEDGEFGAPDEDEHWLSRTVGRIKRGIDGLLGKKDERHGKKGGSHRRKGAKKDENQTGAHAPHRKRKPRAGLFDWFTTTTEQAPEQQQVLEDDDEKPQGDILTGNVDDEDSLGSSGSGDFHVPFAPERGVTQTKVSPPPHPRYYRFTFTLLEPYKASYNDRDSEDFQKMALTIKRSIEELYNSLPGEQTATVISIQRDEKDTFNIKVTTDVESLDYDNNEEIRNVIYDQISKHRLHDFTANPDDFNFRAFEETPRCQENELPCKSTQCVPQGSRCNGIRDCNDNSDEDGCIGVELPVVEPEAESPTPPPTTARFPDEGSGDGAIIPTTCRADDVVRCSDGSKAICEDQKCDGTRDCDDGSDEEGCGVAGECARGELSCDVTRCIPANKRCDGARDCDDGTDEFECPTCREDELRCDNSKCIPRNRVCDNVPDCSDGLDEQNCPAAQCNPNDFDCGDGQCIPGYLRCDSRPDCQNSRDEQNCPTGRKGFLSIPSEFRHDLQEFHWHVQPGVFDFLAWTAASACLQL